MRDEHKTKEQRLAELLEANECVAAVEAAGAELQKAVQALWLTQFSVHQLEKKILNSARRGARHAFGHDIQVTRHPKQLSARSVRRS